MVYKVLVLILGLVPVNRKFVEVDKGIEIFVGTNGVHTNIVVPVKNRHIDWRDQLPLHHFSNVSSDYNFMSIGWGDKGFYIHTPTWADLKLSTAIKALFLPSDAAMHITYLSGAPTDRVNYIRIKISDEQYQKLIDYIIPYFKMSTNYTFELIPGAGYNYNDNFYEAHGSYNLFNTSNNWTNRGLKKIGVRTALWSPLDKPIMYQLKKLKQE